MRRPSIGIEVPGSGPDLFFYTAGPKIGAEMIHENLSQSIEDLSSRIIAIRDSL